MLKLLQTNGTLEQTGVTCEKFPIVPARYASVGQPTK